MIPSRSVPPAAAGRAEPRLQTGPQRAAPRLIPVEPPERAPLASREPTVARSFELVAGERMAVASVDPGLADGKAKGLFFKTGLALLLVLAVIGVASLGRQFLGL